MKTSWNPLQRKVASVLGNEAEISGRSQEVELSIRDLEETTTEDEVKVALQKAAGSDIVISRNSIRTSSLQRDPDCIGQTARGGSP